MNNLVPRVGTWYEDIVNGTLFEVVAVDEDSGTIEYQMVDGEVGEYDSATWQLLMLATVDAPEDWRTPFEVDPEDTDYSDSTIRPDNWSGALSDIEPDLLDLGDDFQLS